jgi:hypothetical protein
MSENRRSFFKKAAGAAAALASADTVLGAAGIRETADPSAARPPFSAAKFSLELEGSNEGFLRSFDGGDAYADVVSVAGKLCEGGKSISEVKYDPIAIDFGTGMGEGLYKWIQAFVGNCSPKESVPHGGAVVASDVQLKEMWGLEFKDALISEFRMPACDASSKEPAYMTLKFDPSVTKREDRSGGKFPTCGKTQKVWTPANFRLTIDGLDCKFVSKVEALVVKQGEVKLQPVDYSNLIVTLPDSQAKSFREWHEDFLVNGNVEAEKNGKLEYLSPNLKDVLFTLTFEQLGIFRMGVEKMEAGSDSVKRVIASMYCTRMTFTAEKAALSC